MAVPSQIAHYRVGAKLGEGGMGEVYRATDTKLNREVAIKVLPASFAEDAARMARFEREAQVLAALNHPNIAAIYGVEQGAIVMELVEGEDLKGPVPVETAIEYARQIAAGLEAAHEKGIVHRDLKPANIKVTAQGVVKLLDFGLAAANPAQDGGGATLTISLTQAGMILGTAAYMSPEQARGKPVDKRADIWAFGVVFFEMLAGRMLFGGGETVSDSLAAVITKEPDWTALPAGTPSHVRRLLERCLRKDPGKRLRDIGDARLLLDEPDAVPPAAAPRARRLPWILAGAAIIASLALAATFWVRPKIAEPGIVRFAMAMPEGTRDPIALAAPQVVPSPDGRYVAFVATDPKTLKGRLWTRALGSLTAQKMDRTEGANLPFWSPDGKWIAFFADAKLKKIAVSGGSTQTICDLETGGSTLDGDGGTWNDAGTIVFAGNLRQRLMRVSGAGGLATPATALDTNQGEVGHSSPQFLPGGRHFLYLAQSRDPQKSGIYVQELGSNTRTLVMRNVLRAAYSDGNLLFAREGTLFAQRLNGKTLQLEGEAVLVAQEIISNEGNGRAAFAASGGLLAYRAGSMIADAQLAWYNRAGQRLAAVGEPGDYATMRLSPDNRQAAVLRIGGNRATGGDVWTMDLSSGVLTRATFNAKIYLLTSPVWSPDSQRLAINRMAGGIAELVTASGATREISAHPDCIRADDWSADGRLLLCHDTNLRKLSSVALTAQPGEPQPKPQAHLETPFLKALYHLSPDGRTIAYLSTESGSYEIHVASFPSFAEKRQVSGGGANYPVWSRDGKELFYVRQDNMLVAVEIKTGDKLEVGTPKPLFAVNVARFGDQYGVTADGKRFLILERPASGNDSQVTLVLNWTAELEAGAR